MLCFSSVLAPKSLQNGLQSGPGGAPGCPGGGPGGPGGGSDVQMSILEAPECRASESGVPCSGSFVHPKPQTARFSFHEELQTSSVDPSELWS